MRHAPVTAPAVRLTPAIAVLLLPLVAAGCGQVSELERFGGWVVAVQVERLATDIDLAAVGEALGDTLDEAWFMANVRAVEPDTLLVQFRAFDHWIPGDYGRVVDDLLSAQTRWSGDAFELRLARSDRRPGLVEIRVPATMPPEQSDSCEWARDGECDEGSFCPLGTDWTDCHGGRDTVVYLEPGSIVDGTRLRTATFAYEENRFALGFDAEGMAALVEARAADRDALLAIVVDGEIVAVAPLDDVMTATGVTLDATYEMWQLELSDWRLRWLVAPARVVDEWFVEPVASEGRGSKYPW